jgi:hypothetical protein
VWLEIALIALIAIMYMTLRQIMLVVWFKIIFKSFHVPSPEKYFRYQNMQWWSNGLFQVIIINWNVSRIVYELNEYSKLN